MLYWVIQITIASAILIFLVHHLITFFTSTLTVPKIKDLVNTTTQKYENMYDIIKQNAATANDCDKDYTLIDLLPTKDESSMKNELKTFLKKQLHSSTNLGMDIDSLDSITDRNTFSNY